MRVLLTTDTIGGVWTYTKELLEGLLERSCSVALVSFGRLPSSEQSRWCATMSDRYGADFAYVASETPLEWMDRNEGAYRDAEALLLDLAQSFGADLLHSNQFCFGKLPASIPTLIVAHSDVLSWAASCRPHGLDRSPWLDRYKSLVQTGLAAADVIVAPTHWMLQALADCFTLPAEAYVIANGRDLPKPSRPMRRCLQAATIGRLWDEAKGLSILANVAAPFPIMVAGEGQHGSQNAPARLGKATPLGWLEDESLLDLLRSSSIYLALSVYEPFGLAPLEAALCGCAVVARNIPSFHEIWGSAALYLDDADTLSSLLSELAADPELLADLQRRAFERALGMSRATMTELYLDLYRHLLEPAYAFQPAARAAEVQSRVS